MHSSFQFQFNFILSFLMPDLSKFRECIEPPIPSEYSLQTVKQYRPLEKKAHEIQTNPHFHMVYRPQKTVLK